MIVILLVKEIVKDGLIPRHRACELGVGEKFALELLDMWDFWRIFADVSKKTLHLFVN